jgi:hypothetical protein
MDRNLRKRREMALRFNKAQRKRDEIKWMRHHNGKIADRLERQMKESRVMKDIIGSIMQEALNPAEELAEEMLFSGQAKDFDDIMDANVSTTSYYRVLEQKAEGTGESPYSGIMLALDHMENLALREAEMKDDSSSVSSTGLSVDTLDHMVRKLDKKEQKRIQKLKRSSMPKSPLKKGVLLSPHTVLAERRRKLMMKAMMFNDNTNIGESRESARQKLDNFISRKNPDYLAAIDDDSSFMLPSEETSRAPSITPSYNSKVEPLVLPDLSPSRPSTAATGVSTKDDDVSDVSSIEDTPRDDELPSIDDEEQERLENERIDKEREEKRIRLEQEENERKRLLQKKEDEEQRRKDKLEKMYVAPTIKDKAVYKPKWTDYDVMRNRWNYIWPQTKELKHEDDQLVPTDTAKIVVVPRGHLALKGSIFDASTFQDTVSRAEEKQQSLHTRSILSHSRASSLGRINSRGGWSPSTRSPQGSITLSRSGTLMNDFL